MVTLYIFFQCVAGVANIPSESLLYILFYMSYYYIHILLPIQQICYLNINRGFYRDVIVSSLFVYYVHFIYHIQQNYNNI